jgi:glycosyltransferase involved in cell wall biosynthesis
MAVSVSVVIPTYKSAPWIDATLSSVLNQTYPADSLEVIVVDDASPDDTVARARDFLKNRPVKSQVIAREKNGGVAAGRNIGWRAASGDWIQFLDGDDLLAPHKIALQAEAVEKELGGFDVAYSNWQAYWPKGETWHGDGPVWRPFVDEKPVLQILQELTFGYVGPALIRRALLEKVAGFGEQPNLGEDMDLMLRMAIAGARFRQVPSEQVAFYYRQWPDSLGRNYSKNVEARRNHLRTFRRAEEFLRAQNPDGKVSEDERRAVVHRYSRDAEFFLEHDPDTYKLLLGWLSELGERHPEILSPNLRHLAKIVGYERAVRLRAAYRKGAGRLRELRGANRARGRVDAK